MLHHGDAEKIQSVTEKRSGRARLSQEHQFTVELCKFRVNSVKQCVNQPLLRFVGLFVDCLVNP